MSLSNRQQIPGLTMANPCIELLKAMLADAEAGRISTIAVIAVSPQTHVAISYAGGQRGDLYVGTGLMQKRLLAEMEAPPPKSTIIPVRVGG